MTAPLILNITLLFDSHTPDRLALLNFLPYSFHEFKNINLIHFFFFKKPHCRQCATTPSGLFAGWGGFTVGGNKWVSLAGAPRNQCPVGWLRTPLWQDPCCGEKVSLASNHNPSTLFTLTGILKQCRACIIAPNISPLFGYLYMDTADQSLFQIGCASCFTVW